MSDSLDIRSLKIDARSASFELYVGFGQWAYMEIVKDPKRPGVMTSTDYEEVLANHQVDNEEVFDAVEDLMDGFHKILSATLNIYEEDET